MFHHESWKRIYFGVKSRDRPQFVFSAENVDFAILHGFSHDHFRPKLVYVFVFFSFSNENELVFGRKPSFKSPRTHRPRMLNRLLNSMLIVGRVSKDILALATVAAEKQSDLNAFVICDSDKDGHNAQHTFMACHDRPGKQALCCQHANNLEH